MDQRNLIMAIIASVTILLGWQFLYEQPRIEKQAAIKKNTQIQNKVNQQETPDIGQKHQEESKDGVIAPKPSLQDANKRVTFPTVSYTHLPLPPSDLV